MMKPENEILYMNLRRRVAVKVKTDALFAKINTDLDRLHDELLAKLRTMARSTGQRTRVDRIHRSTGMGY